MLIYDTVRDVKSLKIEDKDLSHKNDKNIGMGIFWSLDPYCHVLHGYHLSD